MTKVKTTTHKWVKGEEWTKCSECGAAYRHPYSKGMPSKEQDDHCYRIVYPSMNKQTNESRYMVWEILRRYPDRKWRLDELTRDVAWYFDEMSVCEDDVRRVLWSGDKIYFDDHWNIVAHLTDKERAAAKNMLVVDPRKMYKRRHKAKYD